MYDPLGWSSSATFGGDDDIPPWPTTPHSPGSSVPNLRRASPAPPTPDKGPSPGIYGKEPQIYGQPEPGLVSPKEMLGSNGVRCEKPEPYLRVRINGLDRNRRDILVKLDAQTNLSNFNGTAYRNISRSYFEFQQFYDAIVHNNPQTIVPALPLAQTSAPTDEEDDRLVKIMLQRWITRVTEDPILIHDEDVRSFIEGDFGYQPTPRPRRKSSAGFSLIRRGVPDEDEELQRARFELTKLEGQFFETAKAVDKLALTRKALAGVHLEMGNKLVNVATTEGHPPLGNALRKLGRVWHSVADLDQAQAISECVILGDSLGYQGMNARSAKETLQMRTGVLEEYQTAVKATISKKRQIERLKASSNIRPERVDEALEDMEEANRYEQILARRAEGISQNLHRALQTHNRYANDDITAALIEHARSTILYERQLLRELQGLRGDIDSAAKRVVPAANGTPKPTIVPPLEDYSEKRSRIPPPSAPLSNGFHRQQPSRVQHPHTATIPQGPPGFTPHTISNPQVNSFYPQSPTTSPLPEAFGPELVTSSSLTEPSSPVSQPTLQHYVSLPPPLQASSASPSHPTTTTPQSPVPRPAAHVPPLGGRFIDGTKSMFVTRPTSSPQSSPPAASASANNISGLPANAPMDPLRSTSYPTISSPLHDPLSEGAPSKIHPQGTDPLASVKAHHMSSSMRVQPTRRKLDAREAASKLANMF